jgi:hypothetical protein
VQHDSASSVRMLTEHDVTIHLSMQALDEVYVLPSPMPLHSFP